MHWLPRLHKALHGFGVAVFKDWATKGITVVAHDSQGYGRSRGDDPQLHAYMDNFQHWVDDVYQVRKVCCPLRALFCLAILQKTHQISEHVSDPNLCIMTCFRPAGCSGAYFVAYFRSEHKTSFMQSGFESVPDSSLPCQLSDLHFKQLAYCALHVGHSMSHVCMDMLIPHHLECSLFCTALSVP